MSRAARLLELLQVLRRHRQPVAGAALAQQLGISLRTLYRDIASLQAQGAAIEGEAGLGYLLKPGFVLPPLMFTAEELEALVLGSRWVIKRGKDARLAEAARRALDKISAVLPAEARHQLDSHALLVGPAPAEPAESPWLARLRAAIRDEQILGLTYRDLKGRLSERRIWPFALGYFEQVELVVAWCEQRQALRNFRVDHIQALQDTGQRYPRPRQALLKEWQAQEKIAAARN
ncbi:putative DNA-binding transcriptional regulator YafY [Paucibacter oligotrophus]|uniref:Putative DNA-binding transcriptional regulator YafY n=1 Tax=Roseateles oligotrophus TaxID=1769250 RepID=A0A840L4N5_9BURK|nr:YafY family protein [Roseateles oligotrophus]MBB4841783.1 putative DNA-binding transcriptional regulator YafY [Roseateles oligotrophus]